MARSSAAACAVCGRPVEDSDDARRSGDLWFCSPAHFLAYESRAAVRTPRLPRPVLTFGPLVLLIGLGLALALSPSSKRSLLVTTYQARLDPPALTTADKVVRAEYVTGDCSGVSDLFDTTGPVHDMSCSSARAQARSDGLYLVARSRRIKRDCLGGGLDGILAGDGALATECVAYTVVGREPATDENGQPFGVSHPAYDIAVLLQRERGRWRVVAESVFRSSSDSNRWGRRVPRS